MKKLIIAAVAIAIAAVSQAATVKWTASNVYNPATQTKVASSYIAYFVDSTDYTYNQAMASVMGGDVSFLSEYGVASKTFTSGAATNTIRTDAENGSSWTGYLVILNTTDLAAEGLAFVTDEVTKEVGSTGQAAAFSWSLADATKNESNWYAVNNVPEPTSGLLLLFGLAGIALKRKVA